MPSLGEEQAGLDSAHTCWNLPQLRYKDRLLELHLFSFAGLKKTALHCCSSCSKCLSFTRKYCLKESKRRRSERGKDRRGEGRRRKKNKRGRTSICTISRISLICKPGTQLQYNNAIMRLPCLASCEQFSETANNSGLVRNTFKKKTTEHCKKRWILTYQSTCANKCTRKHFTLLSAHMGHDTGVGIIQAYKRLMPTLLLQSPYANKDPVDMCKIAFKCPGRGYLHNDFVLKSKLYLLNWEKF